MPSSLLYFEIVNNIIEELIARLFYDTVSKLYLTVCTCVQELQALFNADTAAVGPSFQYLSI